MNRIFNIIIITFFVSNVYAQNNCGYTTTFNSKYDYVRMTTKTDKFAQSTNGALVNITDEQYILEYKSKIANNIPKEKRNDFSKYHTSVILMFDSAGHIFNTSIRTDIDCYELLTQDEWCTIYQSAMNNHINMEKVKILETARPDGQFDFARIKFFIHAPRD
nr:MAG TPA: hypothetical protein [Bacteriophage sp.]